MIDSTREKHLRGVSLFCAEFLKKPRDTAAVVPSSRHLAAALLKPIDFSTARVVVEFGPGTGAVTREILRHLRPESRLMAFEVNRKFITHLNDRCSDSRLISVLAGAESIASELRSRGVHRVDAIVSSLGLTTMPAAVRHRILFEASKLLSEQGVYTQFQYVVPRLWRRPAFNEAQFLAGYFEHVSSVAVLRNLPPAHVFCCREARRNARAAAQR